ncbi:hypothetical protein CSA56_14860 [candidate division KSB3 bacterium]|uniref:PPM-type phosphatase domain-containing protein n=1 Tax=candidate division KSB3 bacterium TaxID=2044937 RepID=A0A2G6KA93_9BACT|nr:MAG: hypothetical protein CSA56_14860 [candidate division KSB3 bacterium]
MEILGVGLTDVGCKRKHNEDAFLCNLSDQLFIVADGMGGRAAGETASKAVTTVFPVMLHKNIQALQEPNPSSIVYTLGKTLNELSQSLYREAQHLPEIKGLGSTAVLLFIRNDMAYIACAGDSRAYLLRNQYLTQITKDQTVAAALVRTGHLSPEKISNHPLSHALEEYIGKEGNLNPGVWCKKLQVGDRWLLCSDGLTKGVTDHELQNSLLRSASPEEICQLLISQAKDSDGSDNITVVVVDVKQDSTTSSGENTP